VLATPDGQETDKRNLHARKRAERIPRSIADIKPRAIPSHANQYKSVQRQQVSNEDITAPRRHHVTVEERGQRAPEHGSILDCLDPQEEGKDQQKDGNGLVVIAARY
jgi:hypothetical protein